MTEKIIGTMCLMDRKYYWCSYQKQIITIALTQLDQTIIMIDNDIHVTENSCEFCRRCFNTECEYNDDKNMSYIRDYGIELTEKGIKNIQKGFRTMDKILHEDVELCDMLNSSSGVISGYEWSLSKE